MAKSDAWGTGWMVVAMVLLGLLVLLGVLAWSRPWEGWSAVAALGGWAAAVGTFTAAFVALKLGRKQEDWQESAFRANVARSKVQILSSRVALRYLVKELRQYEKELKNFLDGSTGNKPDLANLPELSTLLGEICAKAEKMQPKSWAPAHPPAAIKLAVGLEELIQAEKHIRFASEYGEGRELESEKGARLGLARMIKARQHWIWALGYVELWHPNPE